MLLCRIAGRGYLPAGRCTPVHRRLVLLRVDWIGYVGVACEELMAYTHQVILSKGLP